MSTGFHSLTVAEVRRETGDSVSIRFAVPEDLRDTFAFRPGQHLTIRADIGGEELRRNYSVCAAPQDGELRIAIKEIADGRFSRWANRELAAGAPLDLMPPHGSFTWSPDAARAGRYAGFAGGSGITPILSILKTILLAEPKSHFTLCYGNRDGGSIMFLEELARLKDRFMGRLSVHHVLEHESRDSELLNGRLDEAKIAALAECVLDAKALDAAFICGPGPMMSAVERGLAAAGVPTDRILIERFTVDEPNAAQRAEAQSWSAKAQGLRVEVNLEGRRRWIDFDPEKGSILENVRAAGVSAPYACKAGVCATCRAKLLAGEVHMAVNYGLSAAEREQGYVLTCQSVPVSGDVRLDYDA